MMYLILYKMEKTKYNNTIMTFDYKQFNTMFHNDNDDNILMIILILIQYTQNIISVLPQGISSYSQK